MTYCINSECPFRNCEKHLSKSRNKGKVYVANFDGICERYITWMLKECEECMKDAPHDYCCKLECGEHEFCRGCQKVKTEENAAQFDENFDSLFEGLHLLLLI